MPKILITGASGFIGSFIVEEALKRGFSTWAAVRKSSSRRYLTDKRINFMELDLGDTDDLKAKLSDEDFDYVVHAAGLTKCLDPRDFRRVNTEGTANLAAALRQVCPSLKRLVFISSLSVMGPVREKRPYTEISGDDTPMPDTAYGRSKLEAEAALDTVAARGSLPFTVLRPTGVYGPRERDYFMMAESIKRHVDFSVGYEPQDLTFVYVADLVRAVFLALDHGRDGARYFISDGGTYPSRAFSDLLRRELGNPWTLRIKAPLWLLRAISAVAERAGRITGHAATLNGDKYRIMKQRNWRCDISPAERELGYKPAFTLDRGVAETVKWYKQNGWI